MNSNHIAEHLIADTWYARYIYGEDMSTDEVSNLITTLKAQDIETEMLRAMYSDPEQYDEDWFPIIATKGIRNQLNWNLVLEFAVDEIVNDEIRILFSD
jgi:hypothetical protein